MDTPLTDTQGSRTMADIDKGRRGVTSESSGMAPR